MSTWAIARGTASAAAETDLWRDVRQRRDDERDVLVEVDTELGGAAVDVVTVDGAREALVLELLPDRRRLEAGDHSPGPHERDRVDKSGELVAGVERAIQPGDAGHATVVRVRQDRAHRSPLERPATG